MTRILITGATGALGSQLITRFSQRADLIILGTTSQASLVNKDLVFCDLMQKKEIFNVISKFQPDYIYNLAASFSNDVDHCLKINFQGPLEILKSIQTLKISTRVVLIGSAAEYGAIKSEDNPVKEVHQLLPVSAYGFSKVCQSNLIGYFSFLGVNVVGARIFNLLGHSISNRLFIGRVQDQISEIQIKSRKFLEVGSLSAFRDYLAIEEACDLLITIGEKGESGQIYHVASGTPILMRDLLSNFLLKNNLSMNDVLEDLNYSNRQGFDVPIIYADMEKTNNLLAQ
jgi:GDP-4-dehydro-6-deoxy-D-mannose reductase